MFIIVLLLLCEYVQMLYILLYVLFMLGKYKSILTSKKLSFEQPIQTVTIRILKKLKTSMVKYIKY